MTIEIGTAPDAWGIWFPDDARQIPWQRFLDEVAQVGYGWIELGPYGYLPTDAAVLRGELATRGLKICACIVEGNLEEPASWPDLERQILGGGELAASLDARFIVLIDDGYFDLISGKPKGPKQLDDGAWRQLVETTQRAAKMAREQFGLQLLFHPNAETHVETEDQIERLLAQTDADLVGLCLDTGHHAYLGGDVPAFMRKHLDRPLHVHLKNVNGEVLARVKNERLPMPEAVQQGVFCDLGAASGVVDFVAVAQVLRGGYEGLAMVEQDCYPVPFDVPLGVARQSRQHLCDIGLLTEGPQEER